MSLRCRISVHVHPVSRAAGRHRGVPSLGTVGDSFDNALTETVNGYYKSQWCRSDAVNVSNPSDVDRQVGRPISGSTVSVIWRQVFAHLGSLS
jgi:hypothetical protein